MFNLNYYAFAACMQLTHEKDYTGFLGGGWRDQMRKGIFVQQNEAIKQHNSRKSSSYRRELNKFSDMVTKNKTKSIFYSIFKLYTDDMLVCFNSCLLNGLNILDSELRWPTGLPDGMNPLFNLTWKVGKPFLTV
jgi:hypothetical protein